MRHVRSILYALVLAPAAWVLAGAGLTSDLATRGRDDFAVETYVGLLMLLLAGAAYGILVFAPISPAGPTLAGVVFLGVTLWALNAPGSYADAWPGGVSKEGFDLSRPGYGVAALLAVPLLCTALSVRRWQRFEPVVLPIIGQIGRARGSAAVAGTPIAVTETAYLGVGTADPEPTTVLRLRGARQDSDSTTVLIGGVPDREPEADRTTLLPTGDAQAERTTLLPTAATPTESEADRTTLLPSTAPTPDDEPETEPVKPVDEPATEPIEATEEPATEPIEPAEEPATEPIVDGDEPETAAVASAEEPTADVATADVGAPADDEVTRPIALPEDVEQTRNFALGDPDRTDAVPGHEEVTRSLRPVEDVEQTRNFALGDPDRTDAVPDHEEVTRSLTLGGAGTRVIPVDDGERTQVIPSLRSPDAGMGEATRRLPPAARGTVEPPGERTEVFRVPSIAAAEAPDFAEDPTGRIVPPEAGERPTATVADAERPADETRTIPIQRRPADEE